MGLTLLLRVAILFGTFVDAQDGGSDPSQNVVLAHGVLMAALFAILFPTGAIILKLSNSKNAAWIHGIWQTVTYSGVLAGFGIGVYLATSEDNWITQQGHAIIGTIVTAFLFLQAIGGYIHHRTYVKYGKTTILGLIHRWNGRIMLVLGTINGGLGIWLSNDEKNFIISYSVVAGMFYLAWAAIIVFKGRATMREKRRVKSSA